MNRATDGRAGLVHVETEFGHHQEFLDVESTFIYAIEEGSGVFVVSGTQYVVDRGDVLVIPPNNSIYYAGRLKMNLLTVPAWRAENEREIRLVERAELISLDEPAPDGTPRPSPTDFGALGAIPSESEQGRPASNESAAPEPPQAPVLLRRSTAQQKSLRWFELAVYDVHRVTEGRVGLAHEVTELGHEQEFLDVESTFIYSIVDGSGVFMIGGAPYVVGTGDVLVIPPNNPIYFAGQLEMLLVNLPALDPANERRVRRVERSELERLVETYL